MHLLRMEQIIYKLLEGTDIKSNVAASLDYPDKIITTIFRQKGSSQSRVDTFVGFDIDEVEYTAKMQAVLAKFDHGAVRAVDELVNSVFGGQLLNNGISKYALD